MADIFSEIDAELKADRARRLLRRYGGYVLAGVLAIVVVVSARQGILYWTDSRRDAVAEQYQRARLSPTPAVELSPITETNGGYGMLARFAQAAALAEDDPVAAEAIYLQLAGDTGVDPLYREAALVLSVIHARTASDTDTLIARLESISPHSSPWADIRTELLVGLALSKNDRAQARAYLQEWQEESDAFGLDRDSRLATLDALLNGDSNADAGSAP